MSQNKRVISKGYNMEELLRGYFLKSGYYVIRGVPFTYEGFDITDIDVWLYSRASSVSREITIVDSKNRKTPQAIERIFWVQGLRIAANASNAIVATTERRPEVKDFGRKLGVVVLDGYFLQKLSENQAVSDRLSDEEFLDKISQYALNKLDGDWKGRIKIAKSLLTTSLSFDSCNEWLMQAKFFLEQAITKESWREAALRCFYVVCSFIAIGIDYCMMEISFSELSERNRIIKEGFTFGSSGSNGMKRILSIATGLVEENLTEGSVLARQLRTSVDKQFAALNTSILSEYFSSNEVSRSLFAVAKELEQLAMNKAFQSHNSASAELRSLVLCFVDYWGLDRKTIGRL